MIDLLKALDLFVRAADELEIPYYIGGSVASMNYGEARTTRDIDVVLHVQEADADRLISRLESDFHISPVALTRSLAEGDCFNALERTTVFQVDVFTPKPTDWIREQFKRRVLREIAGLDRPVYLCSPEDTVLNKLIWFRIGNEASQQQWRDAVRILVFRRDRLDWGYLREWSSRLDIEDLLARAEKESEAE